MARGDESYDAARAEVAAGRVHALARWRAGARGPAFRGWCERLAVEGVLRLSRFPPSSPFFLGAINEESCGQLQILFVPPPS